MYLVGSVLALRSLVFARGNIRGVALGHEGMAVWYPERHKLGKNATNAVTGQEEQRFSEGRP